MNCYFSHELKKLYLCIKVSCHESTLSRQSFIRSQTLHVGVLEKAGKVVAQVAQGSIYGHLTNIKYLIVSSRILATAMNFLID